MPPNSAALFPREEAQLLTSSLGDSPRLGVSLDGRMKPTRRAYKTQPPRLSPLSWLWHLFFAVGRPRSWAERKNLRLRATFFLFLGVVLTLAVQAFVFGRWLNCPNR